MSNPNDLLQNQEHLSASQLKRLLTELLTKQKLGLYWESSADVVDFDNLSRLKSWTRNTQPATQRDASL